MNITMNMIAELHKTKSEVGYILISLLDRCEREISRLRKQNRNLKSKLKKNKKIMKERREI